MQILHGMLCCLNIHKCSAECLFFEKNIRIAKPLHFIYPKLLLFTNFILHNVFNVNCYS